VPQALEAFRSFSFCLIDAADYSILSAMRCLKKLDSKGKGSRYVFKLSYSVWPYII
jgi:hypothetical protein